MFLECPNLDIGLPADLVTQDEARGLEEPERRPHVGIVVRAEASLQPARIVHEPAGAVRLRKEPSEEPADGCGKGPELGVVEEFRLHLADTGHGELATEPPGWPRPRRPAA